MKWEELTAPEFAEAVKSTGGVCLFPLGCLEKHFDHLPLGTDFLHAHKLCCEAAELEPAIVFPPYFFSQINEARCYPGTIALDPMLTLQLLTAVCDEIARNGLKKIVLFNGHGGNGGLLDYFMLSSLHARKPYVVYLVGTSESLRCKREEILETPIHQHACECETSMMLADFPGLVKMEAIKNRHSEPLNRLAHLPSGNVSGSWYANYPDHYAGDARAATPEKGRKLLEAERKNITDYLAAVKKDDTAARLIREFHDRCDDLGR
jgi:creatinine amidohydrolase